MFFFGFFFPASFFFKPSSIQKCRAIHNKDKTLWKLISVTNIHKLQVSPELCIKDQLPELSTSSCSIPSIGGTCADSSNGPRYLSQHVEGGMERGAACPLWEYGLFNITLESHDPGSGICIHPPGGRSEFRRIFLAGSLWSEVSHQWFSQGLGCSPHSGGVCVPSASCARFLWEYFPLPVLTWRVKWGCNHVSAFGST